MVKFLQTSDWHLGVKLSSLDDNLADTRRKSAFESISSMIRQSVSDGVELIFMPGDLFDKHDPSFNVKGTVHRILRLIPQSVRVFILPGTHDYYYADSFWHDSEFANHHVFTEEGFSFFDLDDLGIRVWGVPVTASGRDRNWFKEEPDLPENRTNILLYHGDYRGTGREYDHWDYPFEQTDLAATKFDYVALGHHHRANLIESSGRIIAGYSGSPCGWSFRKSEQGTRCFISGDIDNRRIAIAKEVISTPLMHHIEVDLSQPSSSSESLDLISKLSRDDFIKIDISGSEDPLNLRNKFTDLIQSFKNRVIVDNTAVQGSTGMESNVHLKSLIEKLADQLSSGDIDQEYHSRLIKRARQIFD